MIKKRLTAVWQYSRRTRLLARCFYEIPKAFGTQSSKVEILLNPDNLRDATNPPLRKAETVSRDFRPTHRNS
ncbi:hypothetical protein [Runella zeae]|uniref:hypothetical protein n=1 Tax=Runella zeae TaxID=94255 RepID=UPI00048E20CC|nr:hypothetical protein [Runella zeae]